MAQGIGYKDADGSFGFRLTEDGKVILGNSSDDVIQITGTLSVNGTIENPVGSTNYPLIKAGDYHTWYSSYGAPTLQNPHLTNTLYLANTRFAFDANVSNAHRLFNGEYNEGAISTIASGSTTSVFTLNLTSSGVLADAGQTNGVTYPQGFFVLHFHASSGGLTDASQIIVTLSYNDDSESVIPASDIEPLYYNTEDYRNVWKVNLASTKNYLQKIKLDIKGGSRTGGDTSLVEVEYYQERIGQTGLDFSGFTKYASNIMYNDLDFRNSSNTEVASITNSGVGTFASVAATTLAVGGTTITATGTELNYVDGVTSAIQTQLDAKAPSTGIASAALEDNCVIPAKVNTSVVGNGLTGGGGAALAVGAGTGVTVNSNDVAIGQAVGTGDTVQFSKVSLNTNALGSGEVMRIKGTDDEFNTLVVFGTDTTTEYVGLGVNSGVPTITGGYSGTTGASSLAFSTQAGSGTGEAEKVRITSDGKMGIGTTTPHANLSIEGDADGGVVSIRLGADDSSASNFSARLEMAEDTDGSQVMTYGAFLDYDGDASSPDNGMLHIGVRDNSTSDTNVVSISRKADANTFTLGDTSAQISVSGEVGLTSSGGNLNFDAPGNDINLNGTVNIGASNDLAVASTAQFTNTVTMTGDLNVDSNTLFVDASDNDIRIGTTTAVSTEKVLVRQTSLGVNTGIMLSKGTTTGDEYLALDISEADVAMITAGAYGTGDCALAFRTSNSSEAEVMRLSKEGRLGIGTTSPSVPLDVVGQINASTAIESAGTLHCDGNLSADGTNNSVGNLTIGGTLYTNSSTSPVGHIKCNNTTDGTTKTVLKLQHAQEDSTADFDSGEIFVDFYDSNSRLGYIHSEVTYATFTGAHVSQQKSGEDYSGWKKGLILSSTGEVISSGDMSRNWIQVGLSQHQKDPKVAGVFTDFMTEHELKDFDPTVPAINYNALGEGKILVTNINGNIENGDYITTCEIPGYGMKQDDDLLHNYTVAKITQDCLFDLNSTTYECEEIQHNGETYRAAFVGCTYHCG